MRRWAPPLLTLLGLAAALTGWWRYRALGRSVGGCNITTLYDDFNGPDGLYGFCQGSTGELYVDLALIAIGPIIFVVGWFLTLPPRLGKASARTRVSPWLLAVVLLLPVVAAGYGARQIRHQHNVSVDRTHHQAAQRVLDTMALPAGLIRGASKDRCPTDYGVLCATSRSLPKQLRATLIALLKGSADTSCPPGKANLFPCSVSVRGTIDGYPAFASASVVAYFESNGGAVPSGATLLPIKRPVGRRIYISGSVVQISLIDQNLR